MDAVELAGIRREIRAGKQRLILLKLEQEAIARDIRRLRRARRDLVQAVQNTNEIYQELQQEIRAMIELIPFTAEEKEKIQSVLFEDAR